MSSRPVEPSQRSPKGEANKEARLFARSAVRQSGARSRRADCWTRLAAPRRFLRLLALLSLVSTPALAGAADDWASSLYSEGGVELRADERIFTLFAALNALDYDEAPIVRTEPIPRRELDPVRQRVRDAIRLDPKLRGALEAFLDKHPQPLRTYVAFVLATGAAPKFAVEKPLPKEAQALKGLEALLADFYQQAKVKDLFAEVSAAQRDALKKYAPVVDAPLAKARELLKVKETDDSPRVVLVVNLLDGRGAGLGVGFAEETYLVVGPPGDKVDVTSAVKAFARVQLQDAAEKKASSLKGGAELLGELRESGKMVGAESVGDYVAETLARAVALRAALPDGAVGKALDAEHRRGFVLIKELSKGIGGYGKAGKPLDAFLADLLREVDGGKAAAALKGN